MDKARTERGDFFQEPSLATYVAGLKTHDVAAIGASLAEEVRFVTPVKTMEKTSILEFLAPCTQAFRIGVTITTNLFGVTKDPIPSYGGRVEHTRQN